MIVCINYIRYNHENSIVTPTENNNLSLGEY